MDLSLRSQPRDLAERAEPALGSAWIIILSVWAGVLLHFDPSLFVLMGAAPHVWQSVCVGLWIVCLNGFWFFAVYYLVMGIIAAWFVRPARSASLSHNSANDDGARVVILYPTRNDFRETCVEALLRLDWPNYTVVICDDSTLDAYQKRIDEFVAGSNCGSPGLRVIRRRVQAGWKAGNLNFALRQLHDDFDYFAICDCDGIFPADFIRACLPFFSEDEIPVDGWDARVTKPAAKCAFVQCRQEANPAQPEAFGRLMAPAVGAHFRHCVAARARFGFVMFYGHGALISMRAWKEVGGLPESVTEDLAFSLLLRARGWHGVYAPDIVCFEDFPPTYFHLRKRTDKWIRGTGECLLKYFGAFCRSRRVPLSEKLDVLVHGATHFMAAPMFLFLLLLASVLPMALDEFRVPGGFFVPAVPDGKTLVERALTAHYHVFWSWDFFTVMLLTTVGGWLPFFWTASERKRHSVPERLRYFCVSTWVYLASLVTEFASVTAFTLTHQTSFNATYDPVPAGATGGAKGRRSSQASKHLIQPSHPVVLVIEFIAGAGFAAALFHWKNLWFAGPASALLLSPILFRLGFRSRWTVALVSIPALAVALLFLLIGWNLIRR